MNRNNNTFIPGIPSSGIRGTPGCQPAPVQQRHVSGLVARPPPAYLGGPRVDTIAAEASCEESEADVVDFKYIVRERPPVKVVRAFLRAQLEDDSDSDDPW